MYTKNLATTIAATILLLLSISACASDNPSRIVGYSPTRSTNHNPSHTTEDTDDTITTTPIPENASPFSVLLKAPAPTRARFEPVDSTYIGAWLRPHMSLREFEQITNTRHAIYVHEMNLGDDIPVAWILQCIAQQATPLIVVHPFEESTPQPGNYYLDYSDMRETSFQTELQIAALAQRLGAFNLPMFIAFFPPGHGIDADDYRDIFRHARAVFMEHAPLSAFIWVAPSKNVTPGNPFYPGHDAVDWVGVSLFSARGTEGLKRDVLSYFQPFYAAFSPHKPLAVLPLGISHLSSDNFVYSLDCTSNEIARVYTALGNAFPRVGMVVYGDAFIMNDYTRDDFSISLDKALIAAYTQAVQNENFAQSIDKVAHVETGQVWRRSNFGGYLYNGNFYIDTRTIENELRQTTPRQTTEINGQAFVDASRLRNISICEDRLIIFIDN